MSTRLLPTGDRLSRLALGLAIGLTLITLIGLLRDLQAGGNEWKQGDWLISNAAGLLLGCLLLLAPIYPVATDWDRWLGVSVGAFLFLVLILSDLGLCHLAEAPSPPFWPVLAGLSLVWGLHASVGMDPFNLFRTMATQALFLVKLARG